MPAVGLDAGSGCSRFCHQTAKSRHWIFPKACTRKTGKCCFKKRRRWPCQATPFLIQDRPEPRLQILPQAHPGLAGAGLQDKSDCTTAGQPAMKKASNGATRQRSGTDEHTGARTKAVQPAFFNRAEIGKENPACSNAAMQQCRTASTRTHPAQMPVSTPAFQPGSWLTSACTRGPDEPWNR